MKKMWVMIWSLQSTTIVVKFELDCKIVENKVQFQYPTSMPLYLLLAILMLQNGTLQPAQLAQGDPTFWNMVYQTNVVAGINDVIRRVYTEEINVRAPLVIREEEGNGTEIISPLRWVVGRRDNDPIMRDIGARDRNVGYDAPAWFAYNDLALAIYYVMHRRVLALTGGGDTDFWQRIRAIVTLTQVNFLGTTAVTAIDALAYDIEHDRLNANQPLLVVAAYEGDYHIIELFPAEWLGHVIAQEHPWYMYNIFMMN